MIVKGGKTLSARYLGRKLIVYVYRGSRLVFSAIKSVCCYDGGFWRRDKTWNNNMTWRRD